MGKYISVVTPTWGADPEFFFKREGGIIGSERVIPEAGLIQAPRTSSQFGLGKIIRDGVQAEMNPHAATTCRANFGNEIRGCFKFLKKHLDDHHPTTSISLDPLVEVDEKEMDRLSDKSKILGCEPSLNLYNSTPLNVDGRVYKKRSAGGHLHMGLGDPYINIPHVHERLIAMLDVMVGNTCVLVDQNPLNAERRQVYGRAGEYRKPPHGVEYRTLSNFWLKSSPLTSMVLGLARYAAASVYTSTYIPGEYDYLTGTVKLKAKTPPFNAEKELFKNIDQKVVIEAINQNDYSLAWKTWEVVREFLMEHVENGISGGLGKDYMPLFDHFLEQTRLKGLEYWFKDDPLFHWTTIGDCHHNGFETFLGGVVRNDLATHNFAHTKGA